MNTKKKSRLNAYLSAAFTQFIAIKDNDFKQAQEVFKNVFEMVKKNMGEQCNYFNKYSSQVMYAGSVYDGIKVSRMDEFDMNIVIRLPISYEHGDNGIVIENELPGFVKLKIGKAFDNLDKQPGWEQYHKVTRDWRDSENYLLQSKFRQWLHGIVQKALNSMQGSAEVLGVRYQLAYKESGPAYTLNIRNEPDAEPFALDVDLVPVVKFMLPRAPEGYRIIEGAKTKDWFVVPKPNKEMKDITVKNRCWRLSFQEQEREVIKDCKSLKMTIRLLKKLRDGLEMKKIASYYIKTLFLWKVEKTKEDKSFWQKNLSELFRIMVEELYKAIDTKSIPFFWNEHHNLIGDLKPSHQTIYVDKLKEVLHNINADNAEKVISFLLTTNELTEFKKSEFYQKQPPTTDIQNSSSALDKIKVEVSLSESVRALSNEAAEIREANVTDKRLAVLEGKINDLSVRVSEIEERLKMLEMKKKEDVSGGIVGGVRDLSLDNDLSNGCCSQEINFVDSLIHFGN